MKELWQAIVDYAEWSYTSGNEGNSGEFHDEKEAEQIEAGLRESLDYLRIQFQASTGYLPIFHPSEHDVRWREIVPSFWTFEQ